MMKTTTLIVSTLIILTACGKKEYTVDFLKSDNEVRAKVLEECKNNKQTDTNCKNANEAEQMIKSEEFKQKMLRRP